MFYLIFELTIASTVSEETTWKDISYITIEFSNPSVPLGSTVESFQTSNVAGINYVMTMQSRNFVGSALSWNDDTYTATLTRSDGGGSEEYEAVATHQSSGRYSVTLTPLIAGTYTMTVHLTNTYTTESGVDTEISGSPFSVIVYPG